MNNRYTITAAAPLLRPGLTISAEVSKRYVEEATKELLDLVREINNPKVEVTYEGPRINFGRPFDTHVPHVTEEEKEEIERS